MEKQLIFDNVLKEASRTDLIIYPEKKLVFLSNLATWGAVARAIPRFWLYRYKIGTSQKLLQKLIKRGYCYIVPSGEDFSSMQDVTARGKHNESIREGKCFPKPRFVDV